MRLLALCLAVVSFGTPAFAQQDKEAPKPPKVQHVVFTDTDINAGRAIPEGSLYLAPPKARFDCLIKVRGTFSDKLDESTTAL